MVERLAVNQDVAGSIPASGDEIYDDKIGFGSGKSTHKISSKPSRSGFDLRKFLVQLEELSKSVPQQDLEDMKAVLHKSYKRRFKGRSRTPKYGSINKGFNDLELRQFLLNVKYEKFRLLFKYQAYVGLRIGEACVLHLSNIDFDKRELTIETEKAKKMDSLLIPQELFKETSEFIHKYMKEIRNSGGYVFFKDHDNNSNKLPHVEVNYVRKVFREAVNASGLNQVYGISEETYADHKERRLYRLTSHSLRHYAITRFAKSTNGNVVLASRFARHSRPDITMTYIGKDQEELYRNIDFAFSNDRMRQIKELSDSFKGPRA